jgi:hypothetical protein
MLQEAYFEDHRELERFLFGHHRKQPSIFERVLKTPETSETIKLILHTVEPTEIGVLLIAVSKNFKNISHFERQRVTEFETSDEFSI